MCGSDARSIRVIKTVNRFVNRRTDTAKRKTTLKVIPFENRGGIYSCRVSGTNIGKRVQKNFATQAAAEAFLSELVGAANQE